MIPDVLNGREVKHDHGSIRLKNQSWQYQSYCVRRDADWRQSKADAPHLPSRGVRKSSCFSLSDVWTSMVVKQCLDAVAKATSVLVSPLVAEGLLPLAEDYADLTKRNTSVLIADICHAARWRTCLIQPPAMQPYIR